MSSQKIQLEKNPSGSSESEATFSTADEKRAEQQNSHELAILSLNQGTIGKLIGCNDSSLNIAFILLIIGGILLCGSFIGLMFERQVFEGIFEKLVTFMLTIGGYVMGKSASSN